MQWTPEVKMDEPVEVSHVDAAQSPCDDALLQSNVSRPDEINMFSYFLSIDRTQRVS